MAGSTTSLLLLLHLTLTAGGITGDHQLAHPPWRPRVYSHCPSGIRVTEVRPVDHQGRPVTAAVTYHLNNSNQTDHRFFSIDPVHGNITTARYLDRRSGQQYRLLVVALVAGNSIDLELTVDVTQYNRHPPVFTQPHYSEEVVLDTPLGTPLLTVQATDEDFLRVNRDLRYFLADPDVPYQLDPFLDPPEWSAVRVEVLTGRVVVAAPLPLDASPLRLLVGAMDGGSPQRYALANLTIYIREMPEPQDVTVTNTSDTSLTVCWSPPSRGRPEGYILSYTPSEGQHSQARGSLNLTTAQLHSTLVVSGGDAERGDSPAVEVYRYCAKVGGLAAWTEYQVRVRAWAGRQASIITTPVLATTRSSDYCAEGVCVGGNCTLLEEPPGYSCSCHPGYFGHNCRHHNPCLPHNPCMHFGKCSNVSSGSYKCECLRGFYGTNCSLTDPCVIVPQNPCHNGGTCVSNESEKYSCSCPPDYYGQLCQHLNPCTSSPCQNGGFCSNLTNADFECNCSPGFTGKLCQEEVDECASYPCVRGSCSDLINDFHCECPDGWGGKQCNHDLESCPAHSTSLHTGEFHWPATPHGESVTLPCPYGTRAAASESYPSDASNPLLSSVADTKPQVTQSEWPSLQSSQSEGLRGPPPAQGDNLHHARRTRNVFFSRSGGPSHTDYPSLSEAFAREQRQRRIAASIRTQPPRQAERSRLLWRQHRKIEENRGRGGTTLKHTGPASQDHQLLQAGGSSSEANFQGAQGAASTVIPAATEAATEHTHRRAVSPAEPHVANHLESPQLIAPQAKKSTENFHESPQEKGNRNSSRRDQAPDMQKVVAADLRLSPVAQQSMNLRLDDTLGPEMNIVGPGIKERPSAGAVRYCVLLSNGSVVWQEPNTESCREQVTQAAEEEARDVATRTATPSSVDLQTFTEAAHQLTKIVVHAIHDPSVASSMISALSNMMAVNDSVVAAVGEQQAGVTTQLVDTINIFTKNVALDMGQSVQFKSENLVVEARVLDPTESGDVVFSPQPQAPPAHTTRPHAATVKRHTNSQPAAVKDMFISLPSEVIKMASTTNVRVEFVSYANDKFFRGQRTSGLAVVTARVTDTVVTNLSQPVLYHIPLRETSVGAVNPVCVYWDESLRDWSATGVNTVTAEGRVVCQANHLTAFSILLDPVPAQYGLHSHALSVLTYIGLAVSTLGLLGTVATYALFRTLNRDRSGKIVMNLSLALLLLNVTFIVASQLQPPSTACTALAALLHYLVVAAFAWMLVEALNMYQLLITVFASSETHFMAKRVAAAWGCPIVVVGVGVACDLDAYGNKSHGFCVISPSSSPTLYYTTYLAPICIVLFVNLVVFVLVTRVLCQRRPHSHKHKPSTQPPKKQLPITMAQVRGAVTVVALLGVTWVAGVFSVGWARVTLLYLFCITTPLQGLIIFVVRVAQYPEARAAWLAFLTTGTLRRRPPTTVVSTHSSAHTNSTSSSAHTPRNHHSLHHTTSSRLSLRNSTKTSNSTGSGSSRRRSLKNGTVMKHTSGGEKTVGKNSSVGKVFSQLLSRMSSSGLDQSKTEAMKGEEYILPTEAKSSLDIIATPLPDYPNSIDKEAVYNYLQQADTGRTGSLYRPQSLVLLRTDSHGGVASSQHYAGALSHDDVSLQFTNLLSKRLVAQELEEASIPQALLPGRSLGSLGLLSQGKEGDDSSWHFVRPPPDGHSNPVSEGENTDEHKIIQKLEGLPGHYLKFSTGSAEPGAAVGKRGCLVLAGQRIATNGSPLFSGQRKGNTHFSPYILRTNSESQISMSHISQAELRRSTSVYALGEWEDPRSSLA